MLDRLQSAWRARHVLLLGEDRIARYAQALLEELGAQVTRMGARSDAMTLCRAMSAGRVCAVIVPRAQDLCDRDAPDVCLARLHALLVEAREAGVPLVLLGTDAPIYRARDLSRPAREDDALGGGTREGLTQSLFELYADGVSRGLLGDAVATLRVRAMPCLGGDAPGVSQYARWCEAILRGDVVRVEHPGMQGAFAHPLDVACGMLLLSASFLARPQSGAYNLGLEPRCLCANRTAALRLIARAGGERPLRESEPPLPHVPPLLDGSRARALCGAVCRIPAEDALFMLLELLRAEREGETRAQAVLRAQTRRHLRGLA